MLSSIHPLGERARHNRWGVTAAAYLLGSALAGALGGALLGAAGVAVRLVWHPSRGVALGIAAAACLLGAATDLGLRYWRLPTIRRQVNEDWLNRYRGWVYGFGFGAQLGLGVVTIVTTATVYVAALFAVLVGAVATTATSVGLGAAVGTSFGVSRALPLLLLVRVNNPEQLRSGHRRLAGRARLVERVAPAGLAVAGLALAGRALS
jgi:MFS family permease